MSKTPKTEPRAMTEAEVTETLLDTIRALSGYWAVTGKNAADACDGLAFSILALLDGCNMSLPGFTLTANAAYEDKADAIASGENWIEPGMVLSLPLHEQWAARIKS